MSCCCWLSAIAVANLTADLRGGRMVAVVLAAMPGFLAGAWAGTHPEIREWPLIRLISIWLFPMLGLVAVSDTLRGEGGVVALALFAPVAIFTVRWFELRGSRGARPVSIPATTPGGGTPIP